MQSPQFTISSGVSMATTSQSNAINLEQYFGFAVQANYSGTSLDGTFSLEASCDYKQDPEGRVLNAGTWSTIPDTSVNLSSASAGTYFQNIPDANYAAARLVYTTAASDVGTFSAFGVKKGF